MKNVRWLAAVLALLAAPARIANAYDDLAVEIWTDRGSNAVYEINDDIEITARASDDAYLLVYEIDSEGYVRMLYPMEGSGGWVEGREALRVPPSSADYGLAVQGPEGVGYIVALASSEPFRRMPWFLRPHRSDADPADYSGEEDDEEGITREGRIVGDPFVAMERIRRRVLDPELPESEFASAYVSYYVGHRFRYPRYLCYDCHRPGYWAWWHGFDPYYTTCSVFSFRVNVDWWWGYPCWTGYVPYYVYYVRPDCPPFYRTYVNLRYSAWDGWRRWCNLFGNRIVRYKPPATPLGYQAPQHDRRGGYVRNPDKPLPPGFREPGSRRGAFAAKLPPGRMDPGGREERQRRPSVAGGGTERRSVGRLPSRAPFQEGRQDDRRDGRAWREPTGRSEDQEHGIRSRREAARLPRSEPVWESREVRRGRNSEPIGRPTWEERNMRPEREAARRPRSESPWGRSEARVSRGSEGRGSRPEARREAPQRPSRGESARDGGRSRPTPAPAGEKGGGERNGWGEPRGKKGWSR